MVNNVPERLLDRLTGQMQRFSEYYGIPVLGVLPHDKLLSSISVNELAKLLNGEILVRLRRTKSLSRTSVWAL